MAKQIKDIKYHLENAQNPLFLYDNDPDGFCSAILLRKYIGRGKGVAIKSFPELEKNHFRKVDELNADYIFILDKALVSEEFFEKAKKKNIPVVWIDHHETEQEIPSWVHVYNPQLDKNPSDEPTTFLCSQINNKRENFWIVVAGCVSDHYFPECYTKFKEDYPELSIDSSDSFEIFYNSQVGKIARIVHFGLKDRTTNVVKMFKYFVDAKGPYDILNENKKNSSMHERFESLNKKFEKFVKKAEKNVNEKILFFKYSGETSMSSDIANYLHFKFPEKLIFVAYLAGGKTTISFRGEKVRKKISSSRSSYFWTGNFVGISS